MGPENALVGRRRSLRREKPSVYRSRLPKGRRDLAFKLRVANGKILVAHAVGTVKLKLQQPDGSITEVLLHNVVFHPDFSHNLLSVRRLWRDNRIKTRFGERNYFKEVSTPETFLFPIQLGI